MLTRKWVPYDDLGECGCGRQLGCVVSVETIPRRIMARGKLAGLRKGADRVVGTPVNGVCPECDRDKEEFRDVDWSEADKLKNQNPDQR